jgi:hypothetical protein
MPRLSTFAAAAALLAAAIIRSTMPSATHAQTDSLVVLASSDGHAETNGEASTLDTTLFVALVFRYPDYYGYPRRRAMFEYDISAIPPGSTIESVTWRIQTSSEHGHYDIFGYSGEGQVTLDDLSAPSTLVGTHTGGTFGIHVLALDTAWMQSLVNAGAPFAGLLVDGKADSTSSLQISTREINPPTNRESKLVVRYAPATLAVAPAGPAGLVLAPNAPNPFRDRTQLRFSIAQAVEVRLRILDVAGREVRTLVNGPLAAGPHTVRWDGCDATGSPVAPGVYLQALEAGGARLAGHMVRMR